MDFVSALKQINLKKIKSCFPVLPSRPKINCLEKFRLVAKKLADTSMQTPKCRRPQQVCTTKQPLANTEKYIGFAYNLFETPHM